MPSPLEYAAAILLGPRYGPDPWTAKAWPGVDQLSSADLKAVMRAARRGRDVVEARLASAVSGYGHAVRSTRDRFYRAYESVLVGLIVVAFAIPAYVLRYGYDVDQSLLLAAGTGLATACAVFVINRWRGLRFTLKRIAYAEALARRH